MRPLATVHVSHPPHTSLCAHCLLVHQLCSGWLQDVHWGELDYLVIDTPPGTSDEHISIAQFLKGADVDGAVIVTTPQDVAIIDVRKEVNFCKKVNSMSSSRLAASHCSWRIRHLIPAPPCVGRHCSPCGERLACVPGIGHQ